MKSAIFFIALLLFLSFAGVSCDRPEESTSIEPRPAEPLTPRDPVPDSPEEKLKEEVYEEEMKERSLNRENL